MKRGLELLESNSKNIVENQDGSFQVPSQMGSMSYEVRLIGQSWVCTCPDFEYRQVEACKHIFAVRMMIATKTYLRDEPKPKVFAEDAIPCDRCGSIRTIRYGQSSGKQVFKCKDCQHKFTEPSLLKKAKFSPELVTLTLDLYFSGLSLRKIARNLSDHFRIDINYSTIYTWIQKYIPIITEYVNSLAPQLSTTWHADEVFIRTRDGNVMQHGYSMGFLWNIMDRETRFLIASKLTEKRDVVAAIDAFKEAAKNAHGITPEKVHTDALRHYHSGVKVFPNAERVQSGIRKKTANNNRIERMNGTVRERTKVLRGLKTVETPIIDGQRIQYNFVKPHIALDGKTPGQVAGLDVNGWKELLGRAVRGSNGL
ncbi:DDE-type integrase/transposase/recombinase [Nitrososphaera viennensis]|uniref:DDE-type integrase/transposase/recombinase n=2 Tax=Nitrososphaera viennensis TaxID=1034015 RepID=A0A977IDN5_9ARCH|nr:DDE-type integrase/transposase/recombinase [Nitrososphaera viennensis]UVS69099.1 DDE-type integrase/transposase/recombinase [Nitrososphaera viennensis]